MSTWNIITITGFHEPTEVEQALRNLADEHAADFSMEIADDEARVEFSSKYGIEAEVTDWANTYLHDHPDAIVTHIFEWNDDSVGRGSNTFGPGTKVDGTHDEDVPDGFLPALRTLAQACRVAETNGQADMVLACARALIQRFIDTGLVPVQSLATHP
jgi:hypothetical protein